jgi:hypothetical protein
MQQEVSEKYNKVKPYERIIRENKIKLEEIKALADAKAGNEAALKYLQEQILGSEDDDSYSPNVEETTWIEYKLQETREEHGEDGSDFAKLLTSLPDGFLKELEQTGDDGFETIFEHYRAGVFKDAIKQAIAETYLNKGSYIDNYINVLKRMEKANNSKNEGEENTPKDKKKKKSKGLIFRL